MAKGEMDNKWFDGVLQCQTRAEAEAWLEAEADRYTIRWTQMYRGRDGRERAKVDIRSNLGYMAGYYDQETAQKVHDLFGADHPIFGTPDYWTRLQPEGVFEMGEQSHRETQDGR